MNLSLEQKICLRNPFYNSLVTLQRNLVEYIGAAVRYPPAILPFAGVASEDVTIDATVLAVDTDTNFTGVIPRIDANIPGMVHATCLQMSWNPKKVFSVPDAMEGESELGSRDAEDMVALTKVAFPGYFRAETYRLGRYIGIRVDGRLIAMAGHRTRMPGLREISAVCTHPDFTGRGYAQHLIQRLLIDTPDELPYLHVLSTNARAISIYDTLGFVRLGELPFLHIPRSAALTSVE